jgi:hypothetical protein
MTCHLELGVRAASQDLTDFGQQSLTVRRDVRSAGGKVDLAFLQRCGQCRPAGVAIA